MKNSIFVLNNIHTILIITMKNTPLLFLLFCFLCTTPVLYAADTIFVKEARIPVLIERQDNVLFYLRLNAHESKKLNNVVLKFDKGTRLSDIQSVKLYYSGTEALQNEHKNR